MSDVLLKVKDLSVDFKIDGNIYSAVEGVSFEVGHGKTVGLIGESGCGKSVTASSILRLIPNPPGTIRSGELFFNGVDILKLSARDLSKVRGKEISMVFQEPMTALNPVYTIGKQLKEIFKVHCKSMDRVEMDSKAVEILNLVEMPDAKGRMMQYPHELSGGQRQRVMIAMALALRPKLLIADEPTTALDATIQAQILDLIRKLQDQLNLSLIFITHDLGVVASMCHDVYVMYLGKIVEKTDALSLFKGQLHPYTKGLIDSLPRMGLGRNSRLPVIKGVVPDISSIPKYCRFYDRCFKAQPICREKEPPLSEVDGGKKVACFFPVGS